MIGRLNLSSIVVTIHTATYNTNKTGNLLYVQRNTVARSRNHCCNENAAMRYMCIADVHVTINNIEIPSVEQECFYGECMSPATIKLT